MAANPTEIDAAIAEMTVLVLNAVYSAISAMTGTDQRATLSRRRSDGLPTTLGSRLTEITVPQPSRMLSDVLIIAEITAPTNIAMHCSINFIITRV